MKTHTVKFVFTGDESWTVKEVFWNHEMRMWQGISVQTQLTVWIPPFLIETAMVVTDEQ